MGMGALPVAHKLALTAPFLPCHRPAALVRRGRRRRYGAVVAYMEPNPNSPAAIAGRLIGALPVVGLVARILSDEGGVGGDIIDFAEFRRRVSKKCTVMDSKVFYDFNQRRGKVPFAFALLSALVFYLLLLAGTRLRTAPEWSEMRNLFVASLGSREIPSTFYCAAGWPPLAPGCSKQRRSWKAWRGSASPTISSSRRRRSST